MRPVTDAGSSSGARGVRLEVVALVAVLLVSTAGMLVATSRYGIGMTPDSVLYRDGARSLADGLGYSRFGTPITVWPPGYSAVLSVGERLGVDWADWALAVAVASFLATTVLGFVLLRRVVRSPDVVIGGTIVIGCSTVLLSMFEKALSEHLFIVVVLVLLLAADELRVRPERAWVVAGAAACVAAGFYLRYAGLMLLPYGAVVVLTTAWSLGRRRAVLRTVWFSLLAVVAPVLWMLRNASLGDGALAQRRDAAASLMTNIERGVLTVGGWFSFQRSSVERLAVLVAIGALVALVVVTARPSRARLQRRGAEIWPVALFAAGYVTYIVITASFVAFEALTTRYLVPAYVPLVIVLAWTFEQVRAHLPVWGRTAVTVVAGVWILGNLAWFADHAQGRERGGAGGYATPVWQTSELMDDVAGWSDDVSLVTNDRNAIALFTNRDVLPGPAKRYGGSSESTGQLAPFVERVQCEGRIGLAWFTKPGTRSRLYSPEELAAHVQVEPVVVRDDGVLYELTPLPAGEGGNVEVDCP
jgi:hypothetical protein